MGGQILPDAHRQSEKALRESEARFHALVQNALDIVMVTDPVGTIRYMSPSVEQVLGYRPQEMVGTNSAEYVPIPTTLKGHLGNSRCSCPSQECIPWRWRGV